MKRNIKNIFLIIIAMHTVCLITQGQTVTDIDGNVYNTVTIGTQVWMKENLKVTHYRNGDTISEIANSSTWANLTTGAYCHYNNDSNYVAIYGRLYNYYAVSDTRNICPAGWHVPSYAEWETLFDFLGGKSAAGGKMKEAGITHWNSPNTGATNESGFTVLPAGFRFRNGSFVGLGCYAHYWSKTASNTGGIWYPDLTCSRGSVGWYDGGFRDGFSIRCIKDTITTDVGSNNSFDNSPSQYQLIQNYPNPFNPETTINWQTAVGDHVYLRVIDLLGREVATLVNEYKYAGTYQTTFNTSNLSLSSGVYFYTITAGNIMQTKKMILMR